VADLPRLKVAEAVIKESLRLYPPAYFFSRAATAPFDLGPYPVAPGTSLVICPWTMHRDPRFFAEPERFDPARWLDGRSKEIPDYAYIPFGGGPCSCSARRVKPPRRSWQISAAWR
jgi:unspecific monooxygenase